MSRKKRSSVSDVEFQEFTSDYSHLPETLNFTGCRMLACAVVSAAVKEWRTAMEYGDIKTAEQCEQFFRGYAYRFYYEIVPDRLPWNIMRYLEEHPEAPSVEREFDTEI